MNAKVKTWIANVESGAIKSKTEIILNEIRINTSTGYDASHLCGMPKNSPRLIEHGIDTYSLRHRLNISHQSLTAIISNLLDAGLINIIGQIKCEDSYYSVYRYVFTERQREIYARERESQKYAAFCKRGINEFAKYLPEYILEKFKRDAEIYG